MSAPAQADGGPGRSPLLLRVHLFGEVDLRMGEQPLPPIGSARARSLLAHLLIHPEVPHARQRLAFLLWPDSTEAQARTNLRNVLHTLRRSSPEVAERLEVTSRTLRWRGDVPTWVDVGEFTAAVAEADAAEPGSDRMVAALRTAVGLYVDDLAAGCYDEWLVEERERLRGRYLSALRRLTTALADAGEHAEAIRLGRELVRRDALHEDAHRLLMAVHQSAGDRAGAVRAYHECAATLQRELGVEPSPATRKAYADLMRSPPADDGALEPARAGRGTLVGRALEWEQVVRCWRAAEAGRSHLLLVTGEAGVGKTRLVDELSAWCAHRGALVAQARAYPSEGELGYGMVISWLRTAELSAQLRRAGPAERAELARLLPELGAAGEAVVAPTDEAEWRRRLFDAVARTLVASERPTLLVADDAQWGDAQSLQLIHYLVRASATSPVLVAATVRREELDEGHPLNDLASALQIIDRSTEIRLGRLSRADTSALARALTGTDLPAGGADALFAETEGNPLFVVESIRAGEGRPREGSPGITPKLQAVISARLQQLSEPARELLDVAATAGRAFTAALVASASGADEVTLVRALDELWRRGVIREHDNDAYDFTHGKIREAAYQALSPATRRRSHLLVAEALQRLHRRELDLVSDQVAGHYDRAGAFTDAVTWYVRAAQQAQRLYAYVEALRLLDRARILLAELPGDAHRHQELAVLSALPAPLIGVESFASDRLDEVQRRAAVLAAHLGVELDPSLLRSLVMSSLCRDNFEEARQAAERLRGTAQRADDQGLALESEYLLGIIAFWSGEFGPARARFEQVVARFSREQQGEHLLRFGSDPGVVCLSRLGNTLWFLGDDQAARSARDRALAMASEVGHPLSRDTACTFAALLSIDLGEGERVAEYAAAMSSEPERARPIEINVEALTGYVEVVEGRAADGIRRIRSAMERSGPRNHAPAFRAALMRVLVGAHAAVGDAALGLEATDEALGLGGTRIWEAEIRRLRAEFLAAGGGRRTQVEAELARAADVASRQGAIGLVHRIERTRSRLRS